MAAALARPLHPIECASPCAAGGDTWNHHQGRARALPCGGNEAVALYRTRAALADLGAISPSRRDLGAISARSDGAPLCADYRACAGGNGTSMPCVETARTCALSEISSPAREVYVHRRSRVGAHARVALVGCFDAIALGRQTQWVDVKAGQLGDDGGAVTAASCSAACVEYRYFTIAARHQGLEPPRGRSLRGEYLGPRPPCLCGDVATATWIRDEEGLRGWNKKALQPLPAAPRH